MSLALSLTEQLARARADLRLGVAVAIGDGDGSGALILAGETLDCTRLGDLRAVGAAAEPVQHLQLAITARRAQTLKAHVYDGDICRLDLSAPCASDWVRGVVDPAHDLANPLRGPFKVVRGQDPGLARVGIALAKTAQLLPAVVILYTPRARTLARDHGLTYLDRDAITPLMADLAPYRDVISARVPMQAAAAGRVHVFRPNDGADEHYAIEIGKPDRHAPVLVRLHSACFTGDVLGSLKCDCGPQLNAALAQMGANGSGVLLYLNQEGRGIGLANKMRAYALQDQGFDTVEANHRLGFEDDERDFRIGAALLREMGFSSARLLTNNPRKVNVLSAQGIEVVERVPLQVGRGAENDRYLTIKAQKSGHLL